MEPYENNKGEASPLEGRVEETMGSFMADQEALKEKLLRKYPAPECAIEDYRKGYITDTDLALCFDASEIEFICKEAKDREAEDSAMPSGVV